MKSLDIARATLVCVPFSSLRRGSLADATGCSTEFAQNDFRNRLTCFDAEARKVDRAL